MLMQLEKVVKQKEYADKIRKQLLAKQKTTHTEKVKPTKAAIEKIPKLPSLTLSSDTMDQLHPMEKRERVSFF